MKIVFLDIDGVLNHETWLVSKESRNADKSSESKWFNPRCVELLNDLTDATGAKIVLSSSWRKSATIVSLKELFKEVGITGELIDKTPVLYFTGLEDYKYSVPRGCEIKAWLETNKSILNSKISQVQYVIFDDDSDMLWWQRNHFLWVDPYSGLTPSLIYKAKRILK